MRAPKTTNDEIGVLVDAFNNMLDELGQRNAVLEAANRQLEAEAVERRRAESARAASERRNRVLVSAMGADRLDRRRERTRQVGFHWLAINRNIP